MRNKEKDDITVTLEVGGKEFSKRKMKADKGCVPEWAWYITWGIMLSGVALNLIGLLMRFQIIPTPNAVILVCG